MPSSRHRPTNRRKVFLALSGSVESQLRDAYAKKHLSEGVTQAGLGKLLDVDRSVIHKRLVGARNMTLETVADMVWALGHCVRVQIYDPDDHPSNGHRVVPDHGSVHVVFECKDEIDDLLDFSIEADTGTKAPAPEQLRKLEAVR